MNFAQWIDKQLEPTETSNLTLEQVFSEHGDSVKDYVIEHLSDTDKLTLLSEMVEEGSAEEKAYWDSLSDEEALSIADWDTVIDWVLQGVSARELGDSLGIEWDGLKERFGIA